MGTPRTSSRLRLKVSIISAAVFCAVSPISKLGWPPSNLSQTNLCESYMMAKAWRKFCTARANPPDELALAVQNFRQGQFFRRIGKERFELAHRFLDQVVVILGPHAAKSLAGFKHIGAHIAIVGCLGEWCS